MAMKELFQLKKKSKRETEKDTEKETGRKTLTSKCLEPLGLSQVEARSPDRNLGLLCGGQVLNI